MEEARPARPEELDDLVRLARAARAELRDQRGGALWEVRDAHAEPLDRWFASALVDEDVAVIAGTIDDTIVGFGMVEISVLRDESSLGIITELFVEPEARAVGVGESIADALVAFCTERKCRGVDATALPGNREAKNFFERAGFTARSLTMHKPLSP